ncbi:ATP-binding cassette domain-containing protein [Algoriphagus aestuariicola]|uniref:ATP-binding cassette domain-containing protein n=1 Tax=Algoriphagus aestuariicola TaxID=1852016 RepID=A0ABS3BVM9_9BACT|nr:ATP-binding cassette domain-containing protein [Algoriphagus aestuariicola]MBN7803137.1 ATP-binding cassette domain-containing protein [Algoriphagus aestuariicola]
MLETSALQYAHPGQAVISFPEIKVQAGQSLLVLGKSGSGKTTLLNLLSGLLTPLRGEVVVNGTKLSALSEQAMDLFRGRNIGIVFQKPHLIAALDVRQNLELAHFFGKKKGQEIPRLLAELDIAEKAKASVLTLSEGEAQRVSIARALANSPKLILADEPTSSLDDENAEKVIRLLKTQAAKIGAALVIVTHDQRVKNQISNFIEVKRP